MTSDAVGPEHDTLMWEVVAAPGRLGELIEWIEQEIVRPGGPGRRRVDVYRAADDRAVVIAHFDGEPGSLPEPPGELVKRPAHQWPFRLVRSASAG